ncbi:hypothetical protein PV328_000255 [Microctonus aethiopoides]|uniref:RNA-binding protein 48 n=2 Tax=Microctonus aethiopoides TaxID=144406 RepID=A0AA39FV32_9HYME|nr:hypothetical protein PV328_000255 [Microctonus aethiopoides]
MCTSNNSMTKITKLEHHEQQELCRTRPPYRQGKKLTAVKVYTVNDESQHLMICGVPKLQLLNELTRIVKPYGNIKEITKAPEYPVEEFTEAFYVHYEKIQSARIAKRFLDAKNFYGGILHVFYAPELETIAETRRKLIQRRRDIAVRIKRQTEDAIKSQIDVFQPKEQYHRRKRCPALPLTNDRLSQQYPGETFASIYEGIPRNIDPRPVSEPSLPHGSDFNSGVFTHLNSSTTEADVNYHQGCSKRKNYKGRIINSNTKVRVIRPQLIDTKKLIAFNETEEKKVFPVVKKIDNGIKIKLLPAFNEKQKRIVIKDPSITHLVRPSENLQTSIEIAKSSIREAMNTK